MAFPTPPAARIPYDLDGSVMLISSTGSSGARDPMEADYNIKSSLNSNFSHGLAVGSGVWRFGLTDAEYYAKNWIAVHFPRPMNIKGWFFSCIQGTASGGFIYSDFYSGGMHSQLQVSTNSTNGEDGTWTTVAQKIETDYILPYRFCNPNVREVTSPTYKIGQPTWPAAILGPQSEIELLTQDDLMYRGDGVTGPGWSEVTGADNITAVRIFFPRRGADYGGEWLGLYGYFTFMAMILHLYGEPSSDSENRLTLVNADDSGPADLSLPNIDPQEYVTRTIRVKNLSASEDAIRTIITAHDAVPSYIPPEPYAVTFSLDGEDWFSILRLGDIPAEGLSPEVLLRVDPIPGMVGRHYARIHASAGEWS